MANSMRRTLGDILKDWMEDSWYSSRTQQKLFGNIPDIEEFVKLTEGEISIQPQLSLVAPLSVSLYPFEIYVEYKANPNGILIPVFSELLKHYESIERVTKKEYSALIKDGLNNRFAQLGQHRKTRMQMMYHRDARVNLKE